MDVSVKIGQLWQASDGSALYLITRADWLWCDFIAYGAIGVYHSRGVGVTFVKAYCELLEDVP